MPMYDFKCQKCGRIFERLISAEAGTQFCACGGATERLQSAPAFAIEGYSAKNGYAMKGLVANPKYPGKQAS